MRAVLSLNLYKSIVYKTLDMTDKNSEQYVIWDGKKVFVDNGSLDIDYHEVESFAEIEGLNTLKNLKYLYIGPGYGLKRIENLETLTNLEVLQINGSELLDKVENLETLTNLKCLDLRENAITEFKGLDLKNLEILKCHRNKITEIKRFDSLTNLKEL